ncbi:MAG: exodeoxyribonuclease VII small subunit [Anaerolineae bacterium]|nr:exodeoxyribonuclease VII small subunit [Anaerolineae bacterium]
MNDLKDLSYEIAYAELEQIVRQLEEATLTLDISVTLFERGRLLAAHCQTLLDAAELRVVQIDDPV